MIASKMNTNDQSQPPCHHSSNPLVCALSCRCLMDHWQNGQNKNTYTIHKMINVIHQAFLVSLGERRGTTGYQFISGVTYRDKQRRTTIHTHKCFIMLQHFLFHFFFQEHLEGISSHLAPLGQGCCDLTSFPFLWKRYHSDAWKGFLPFPSITCIPV